MTSALASYRVYQSRRLAQPVLTIEPAEYEKQDRAEAALRINAFEEIQDGEFDMMATIRSSRAFKLLVAESRVFTAGDLRSPVVLGLYLEAKFNRTKANRKDRIKFYEQKV